MPSFIELLVQQILLENLPYTRHMENKNEKETSFFSKTCSFTGKLAGNITI